MSKTDDGNVERGSMTWSEASREIWRTQEAATTEPRPDPEGWPGLDLDRMAGDAFRDHSEPHDDCRAPILHRVIAMACEAATLPVAPPALDRLTLAAAIQSVGLPMQYVHRIMDEYARLTAEEPER